MVSAYAKSRALVVILSVLLLSWGTFANFNFAYAVFDCDGFPASIVGTSGDDVIEGTTGDDVIMGQAGNDIINGNGGNDIICSGSGSDVVTTGSGNDYILLGDGDDIVNAGDGNNIVQTGGDDDTITSGSGDDDILGGSGNDTIDAGDGNNHVHGDDGADTITTGSGDDDIDGNDGDDCINSGVGSDSIDGGAGNNIVNTGSCDDKENDGDAIEEDGDDKENDGDAIEEDGDDKEKDGDDKEKDGDDKEKDGDDKEKDGDDKEKDELVLICHLPPGNPTNSQNLMISSRSLQTHLDHGDIAGKCNDANNEKNVIAQIVKKQREEMDKKNELNKKRNELKEIKNEIKLLKINLNNDEDLKDTVKELITDIKETLQTLKSDYDYDQKQKKEIKDEFKDIKQKIYDDLTTPEKNSLTKVDSKLSILSQSDDPKNDAKKLGLDYKNGKTTIAIQLTKNNQKILRELSSFSTIDVKNDNNVQITINLKDLPKLKTITGIENVRPPFHAVQFEEPVSEGVYFMNADLAQYAGITGKGIKVAVFDLSFTNNPKISDNIVEVKSFRPNISVFPEHWNRDEALHGTAVAEIITDVAPNVELFLYSMESDIEFAAAVDEAISKNIDIIAMSAGWPNFPTDGTSPITKKIEEAVENGIVFVVPAGNFGKKHWEGNFMDSNLNNWHDFSHTDEGLSIKVTEERIAEEKPIIVHLMWDVGLNDVADFDLVLVDPLGQIVDFSANKQVTSQDTPFEYIHHIPDIDGIYSLGVLYAGDMTSPKNRPQGALEVFTVNDELEYPVIQSSVSVPADAQGAIVVGAVNHLDGIIEPYSSQGPTNNGKLAPHVVGPDGVTTLALDGKPFYGTSATTPYVAGLAALILEQNPGISPEQLLTLIQQNADRALFSIQNEYDYATGYGTASAHFLIDDLEVMQ